MEAMLKNTMGHHKFVLQHDRSIFGLYHDIIDVHIWHKVPEVTGPIMVSLPIDSDAARGNSKEYNEPSYI